MSNRSLWVSLAAMAAWGCGGGDSPDGDVRADQARTTAQSGERSGTDQYSRETFLLCQPIEEHREELAAIVGFEPDLEREVQGIGAKCFVRSTDLGFVSVELPPAITRSIAMHARSFGEETNPVPELGEDALFVDAGLQPHVIFGLSGLMIDVGAEALERPSRETMIELAIRIRDLLEEANS